LRPEHLAKNVDFRASSGVALLANALARQDLGQLPDMDNTKTAPTLLCADVVECLMRASRRLFAPRATRNSELLGLAKSQQYVKTSFGKVVCELKATELDFPSSVLKTGLYRQ
jgi:hypothetical protein